VHQVIASSGHYIARAHSSSAILSELFDAEHFQCHCKCKN